ncbi:tRNA (N(6)-L-threonylcarbamoyladenosine(37)-C(2))-methylthiotransferase MtaB [Candidatus Peregrinibacteria bacterium]|nr:tRNA (N(6)-L-threonylcarbamoyladenosine(37)-C(2))-methylthiotransferase MtaB [Candidatus Peregrinibacteria bacterium]
MKIAIKTLGCRSNRYESDKLFDVLKTDHFVCELNEGVSTFQRKFGENDFDFLIVNTCTVTHVADRKSRQAIRSFKAKNPGTRVLVFGCGANVSKEDYENMDEVDAVIPESESIIDLINSDVSCGSFMAEDFDAGVRTRALIKIQDGCNNFCTYCIIPHARGREVSFPSKEIIALAKENEAQGFKELVLTGINIGEWQEDGKDIADLIELLINNTSKVRFRISSIEPKNFSDKLFDLFDTGRLCPHMHISLQSGSDSVLRRMKRNYKSEEFESICNRFRDAVPDIGLTTDVIVGFPGETDNEFAETVDFVKNIGFLKVHVFPYSKRKNTAACYMPGHLQENIKKTRARRLRKVCREASLKFKKSLIGNKYEVLVESQENGVFRGYTSNYLMVEFKSKEKDLLNCFKEVKLGSLNDDTGEFAGLEP